MQAWEQFLQLQETELGAETVQKWLRSLKIRRFDACNLYLEANDSFQALWFEEHIRGKAQAQLVNGSNKRIKIHLSVANVTTNADKRKNYQGKGSPFYSSTPFQLSFDELDPLALFKNFITSPENQLTFKILHELAAPSSHRSVATFNPVYFYGATGCGKTHLLMSLAQAFRAQHLKAIYVRAETFTDHVVSAIRAGEMSLFRQVYRHADVLLVDDVHVFSRKGATQEEFFHTFNTLHLQGKQIILTTHCPPQELQLIEPRLISRFEWGIVLPLYPLSPTDLRQMLKIKAQALNFSLSPKLSDFLIESFSSHPKALIKALEALVLRLHLDAEHSIQTLALPAAEVLLADLLLEEQKQALTPTKIIQAVSEHYGVRTEDILGKAQTRECTLPRQLAMELCREKLKLPFMKIGAIFSRDHSTVMAGIKAIHKFLEQGQANLIDSRHAILKKLHH